MRRGQRGRRRRGRGGGGGGEEEGEDEEGAKGEKEEGEKEEKEENNEVVKGEWTGRKRRRVSITFCVIEVISSSTHTCTLICR